MPYPLAHGLGVPTSGVSANNLRALYSQNSQIHLKSIPVSAIYASGTFSIGPVMCFVSHTMYPIITALKRGSKSRLENTLDIA